MSAGHLARRFAGNLIPGGPSAEDEQWARDHLLPAERELWEQLGGSDRRHGVAVAKATEATLGEAATRAVLAAALLHDVGKLDSQLGTYGRVVATLSGMAVGRDSAILHQWSEMRGFTRRVALYLHHPALGGDRLALAGSDPLTVAWAREHHLPPQDWTVPQEVGEALRAADDS